MKPFSRKSFRFFNLISISKNGCHFFPTYWDFPEILGMEFLEKNEGLVKRNKRWFVVIWKTAV
jgi:hypothetical protein